MIQDTCKCAFGTSNNNAVEYNGIPWSSGFYSRVLAVDDGINYDNDDTLYDQYGSYPLHDLDESRPSIQKHNIAWNMDLQCSVSGHFDQFRESSAGVKHIPFSATNLVVTIVVGMLLVSSVAAFFFMRKKKQNRRVPPNDDPKMVHLTTGTVL
jgi:hypothetical protein